jgi:acyl carrier protein
MKDIEIQEKIIKKVSELLNIDVSDIKPASLIVKDLGADSLDVVELVMDLEDTFGIEILDSEIEKFGDDVTIKNLVNLVQSKVKD